MTSARFAHVAANDTLPKLLRYNARRHGPDVALREKELGLWKSYTWSDFHERTKLWALALRSLGVGQGDTVAIIGNSQARLARGGHRHPRRARQEPRPLPGRAGSGGGLSRRLCRGQGRHRRGRGAGRQDAARHGRHPVGAEDRLLRSARHAQIHRPQARRARRAARGRPQDRCRRAGPVGQPRRPDRRRGHRRALLDLRHHLAIRSSPASPRAGSSRTSPPIASCSISAPTTSTSRCSPWAGSASSSRRSISRWCAATSSTSSRNRTRS